jgi:CRISPR-associated protein Csm2
MNGGRRDYGHRGGHDQGSVYTVGKEDLVMILDGADPQKLVRIAEEIAVKALTSGREKVTTSQIRNIFGTVKSLEAKGMVSPEVISKLVLLKPKLAYAAGRHEKVQGMKVLQRVLSDAIDLVSEKNDRFGMFCGFFEAILAYHKAHGGK